MILYMNTRKLISVVGLVLAGLVVAWFGLLQLGVMPESWVQKDENKSISNNYAVLEYSQYGIKIDYPKMVFTREVTELAGPFGDGQKYTGNLLVHSIPIQHCDLSGLPEHCTPYTRDITIGFFIINEPLINISQRLISEYGEARKLSLVGREGVYVTLGVEGEGVHYYFLPLTDKISLMITRSYIDENILSGYKNAVGFFTLQEQAILFEEVIGKPVISEPIVGDQ